MVRENASKQISTRGYSAFESSPGDISLLVILEPRIPYLYRRRGVNARAIRIEYYENGEKVERLSDEWHSPISSNGAFIEAFTYIEFYINQLLKLLLIEQFSVKQWMKLETLVEGKYLRFEDKKDLIKKYDSNLWAAIRPNLNKLQQFRNDLSHNPIGPFLYGGEDMEWSTVDKDLVDATHSLLKAYHARQAPIEDYVKNSTSLLDN